MALHPKIKEIKRRAAPINYRSLSINTAGALVSNYTEDLDNGIVNGYGTQFKNPNDYKELFIKGAFAKSINERGPGTNSGYEIKFFNQHKQDDALSLFETLTEDDYGLRFRTNPLDERDIDTSSAASVLRKLKTRTLNNFSIGFDYVWDKMEYDDKNDIIIMKEARLYEISVVGIPVDMGTYAMRSAEQLEELYDEAEMLIAKLPRTLRAEARELFARHKALMNIEPSESTAQDETTLGNEDEPPIETRCKIDYNYLTKNFKL
jgi:HK97 family phage prohead protease